MGKLIEMPKVPVEDMVQRSKELLKKVLSIPDKNVSNVAIAWDSNIRNFIQNSKPTPDEFQLTHDQQWQLIEKSNEPTIAPCHGPGYWQMLFKLEAILKPIYEKHDLAHKWNHAIAVTNLALDMNEKLLLGIYKASIFIAGLCHDIGLGDNGKNRNLHHLIGVKVLQQLPEIMELIDRWNIDEDLMFSAIEEHRGSYTGEYSSILSELISSADRLEPEERQLMIRCKQTYKEFEPGFQKIQEKYVKGGYARWPKIYVDYFGERLDTYQKNLADREFMLNLYNSVSV